VAHGNSARIFAVAGVSRLPMCRISLPEGCRRQVASGADVTTLAATVEVGLNPNVAMSSRMLCPVAHKRTIAAGVIRGRSFGADSVDHDADLVDQILAPGCGIARAPRHLHEQAGDGQNGGVVAIRDKAPRIDVRTFGDKR